jgi:hypothetical protein
MGRHSSWITDFSDRGGHEPPPDIFSATTWHDGSVTSRLPAVRRAGRVEARALPELLGTARTSRTTAQSSKRRAAADRVVDLLQQELPVREASE